MGYFVCVSRVGCNEPEQVVKRVNLSASYLCTLSSSTRLRLVGSGIEIPL
jgi:hypothetical protein